MNFIQLQDRALLLSSYEAYTDILPVPDFATLVNEAWREFSWDTELLVGIVTTNGVGGQTDYELPGVKAVYDVSLNGAGLSRAAEAFERYLSREWRAQGTPLHWMPTGASSFALSPSPTNFGDVLSCRCCVIGQDMVDDTDEPGQVSGIGTPIASSLHEAVALRAATLLMRGFAANVGAERMADYEARYAGFVAQAKAVGPMMVGSRAA